MPGTGTEGSYEGWLQRKAAMCGKGGWLPSCLASEKDFLRVRANQRIAILNLHIWLPVLENDMKGYENILPERVLVKGWGT